MRPNLFSSDARRPPLAGNDLNASATSSLLLCTTVYSAALAGQLPPPAKHTTSTYRPGSSDWISGPAVQKQKPRIDTLLFLYAFLCALCRALNAQQIFPLKMAFSLPVVTGAMRVELT